MRIIYILAINCSSLHLGPHVKSSNLMPQFNDPVRLSCEEGYAAKPIIIKCDVNGRWPLGRPNCTGQFKCKAKVTERCHTYKCLAPNDLDI